MSIQQQQQQNVEINEDEIVNMNGNLIFFKLSWLISSFAGNNDEKVSFQLI